jgi:hypothetical protein
MPAFERRFLNPGADEVADALVEAVEAANYRCRVGKLEPDPAAYRRFVQNMARKREGVGRWVAGLERAEDATPFVRATLLGLAWWTDYLDRKHVRVVGRRLEQGNEFHQNRFGPLGEARPPLWLVHPDRVVLRTLPGKRTELLAVCGCGMVGRPAALGWMGDCCGPCHDRREEGGPAADDPPPTLAGHSCAIQGLAYSASGKTLVSADQSGWLYFWAPATGKVRTHLYHDVGVTDRVGFACNGRDAVIAGHFGGLAWFDAATGARRDLWEDSEQYGYVRMALSPDGKTLVASSYDDLDAWNVSRRDRPKPLSLELAGGVHCLTFSPDSRSLVIAWHGQAPELLDLATRERMTLGRSEPPAWSLAFAPDGEHIAVGRGPYRFLDSGVPFPAPDTSGEVHWIDTATGRTEVVLLTDVPTPLALAVSPDGRFLAAGAERGLLYLLDLERQVPLATFEWHVGSIECLAFSPDGQTLASAGGDGLVRLWPWRRLLEPVT